MPLRDLLKIAEEGCQKTGLKKVALIGAAVSDYSKIEELCEGLYDMGMQVTTPSLRIESITENLLEILKASGLKTITIAPESTWEVRKASNKFITDEAVESTINKAFQHELNVKLYFMMGLPTETTNDMEDLVSYIDKLIKLGNKRNQIKLSVNPFIPKPHTPFQWEKFDTKTIKSKAKYLNSNIKTRSFKIENPRKAMLQYVLSMGGKELGKLIHKSVHETVSMREWASFAPHYDLDSDLPWHNIDVGIDPEFLKDEYEKALNKEMTPWCEEFGCYNCGSC